jgi:hypothetical protein
MSGAIIRYGFAGCDRRPPDYSSSLGLKFINQPFERLEDKWICSLTSVLCTALGAVVDV